MTKKNPQVFCTSEQTVTTGRQRRCESLQEKQAPQYKTQRAKQIENIEYTIHLFFDDNIMSKIVDNTKNRINETIFRLQRVQSHKKSVDKYPNAQITMPVMW